VKFLNGESPVLGETAAATDLAFLTGIGLVAEFLFEVDRVAVAAVLEEGFLRAGGGALCAALARGAAAARCVVAPLLRPSARATLRFGAAADLPFAFTDVALAAVRPAGFFCALRTTLPAGFFGVFAAIAETPTARTIAEPHRCGGPATKGA
jgi:hypothetical protein